MALKPCANAGWILLLTLLPESFPLLLLLPPAHGKVLMVASRLPGGCEAFAGFSTAGAGTGGERGGASFSPTQSTNLASLFVVSTSSWAASRVTTVAS